MSEQQEQPSAGQQGDPHGEVTVPEDGTYTRRDGSTVELKGGTPLSHEEAVDLGLVEDNEGLRPEEEDAPAQEDDEAKP